jgi:hypothetical protein
LFDLGEVQHVVHEPRQQFTPKLLEHVALFFGGACLRQLLLLRILSRKVRNSPEISSRTCTSVSSCETWSEGDPHS